MRTARTNKLRSAGVALALAAVAGLLAACGSGSASPGVASIGSTTTTTSALGTASSFGQTDQQYYQAQLDYAACMRSHGEPSFPDPVLRSQSVTFGAGPDIDQDSPRFRLRDHDVQAARPGRWSAEPGPDPDNDRPNGEKRRMHARSWDNELPGPDRERPRHNCRFQPQRPGPEFAPVPRRPEGLPETCTAGSGRMNVVR